MHHYVYYSYEEWGRGYIGVRSCKCLPEEDCEYFGSFSDKTFAPTNKIILSTFESRKSALAAEVALHSFFQVHVNPAFANKAKQTSEGWSTQGVSLSFERRQQMREAQLLFQSVHPELEKKRLAALVEGGHRWRAKNKEHLANTLMKATEAARLKTLEDPVGARNRALEAAKVRNQKLRESPDFDKLRLARISKRVILTTPEGIDIEFESKLKCAQYLGVSRTCIANKLAGKNTYKLKGYSVR